METITATYYDENGEIVESHTFDDLPAGTWEKVNNGDESTELDQLRPETAVRGDFVNEETGAVHEFTC